MRSVFAPVVVVLAALIASLVRWLIQGTGNLYTAREKVFYVADPDLGWRVSPEHPIWIGLEACGLIAALAIGLAVAGWLIGRREQRTGRRESSLRFAAWAIAVVPAVLPIAAFASGGGPPGGVSIRPDTPKQVGGTIAAPGIAGALPLPAGRYEVVAHDGTSVTARVSAGGEAFDARFGDIRGSWQGNPGDLRTAMTAEVSIATASIDTGIAKRTQHAREGYLLAAEHPRITFTLDKLISAHQAGADQIAFRAQGSVGLIGGTHRVEVSGTLKQPDAAALTRLGLAGAILLVQGDFALPIRGTALEPDAGDFDGDRIPIHVSLVLRHTSG